MQREIDDTIEPGRIAWAYLEGYPWWPVYIINCHTFRDKCFHLGDSHKRLLRKGRNFPSDFRIVYYFGSHNFSSVNIKKKYLKPWNEGCTSEFNKGVPLRYRKKPEVMEELELSINEAQDLLDYEINERVPVHMVPSDLDKTLSPPPSPEASEEDEDSASDSSDSEGEKKTEAASTSTISTKEDTSTTNKKEDTSTSTDDTKKKSVKEESIKGTTKPPEEVEKSDTAETEKSKKRKKPESKGPEIKKPKTEGKKIPEPKKPKDSELKKEPEMTEEKLRERVSAEIKKLLTDDDDTNSLSTKVIRKSLESTLGIDLRPYKEMIKTSTNKLLAEIDEVEVDNSLQGLSSDLKKQESSVDRVLEILKILDSMTLKMDDLMVNDLAASISSLRSHNNAKVSAHAKTLRKKWKQQLNNSVLISPEKKNNTGDDTKSLLVALRDVLLDSKATVKDQLNAMKELSLMKISYEEFVESKIGVVVSNLRKSATDEAVVMQAKALRKEWKSTIMTKE